MYKSLLLAFALVGSALAAPPPAGYYPVTIATSKSAAFVIEPQAPVKNGSGIIL